ncbi:YdeI/OmpD-associated family protein [Rhodanobacter sp. DHB23]|uniref:YdeI/OmpD-associated family protein n=1 Tax=Rhodanobacter sp. DHB23 TaxID=2775923 RepID=UPI001783868A|nr:YdeI/OmpD-associated family protein [Rhodanobacter sp. DHB23]MBD8872896.1 YdeI/OmpD-associated family protein [Rhodanobacter sp. DHB23]
MANRDPRIDAYIAKSAEFARPILDHLRAVVHEACPEVEETIKWSRPFFTYRDATLCMMSAFKQHCSFGFWLGKQVTGADAEDGAGQFGKLTSARELPPRKALVAFVRKAMALNETGVKTTRAKAGSKPPPTPPEDFTALLAQRKHAAARKVWENFPPGSQREYIDWIVEAKTDATRQKRLATTLEWLAEGKRRNWKYDTRTTAR